MPIDLYYNPKTPGCRSVLMTAEYLNIRLNLILMDEENNKAAFYLNQQNLVPRIVDNGFTLGESRAIMQYLCKQYAPGNEIYPQCLRKRAVVDRMLIFDKQSLIKSILDWIVPQVMEQEPPNAELEKEFVTQLLILNNIFLEMQNYVAADQLTIADFAMSVSVTFLRVLDYDLSKYANIESWLMRLEKELGKSFWDKYITNEICSFKTWMNE